MSQQVPEPGGQAHAWRSLDPGLLRLRRLEVVVLVGGAGVLAAVALAVLVRPAWGLLGAAVAAALVAWALAAVGRRFRAWGYLEREDDLLLRRGVVFRQTTVVPYGRMQYVDVTAGPLDRRFGIASVVLHTAAAATDATVPGVAAAEAARLRDRLAALGEARAAGV